MLLAILAGILIGIAGRIYLNIGGIPGAILFATGLIAILVFKLNLFTGKAGLLTTGEISVKDLSIIWCGNFIGTLFAAWALKSSAISAAQSIIEARLAQPTLDGIFCAFLCGLLMYVAVTGYK